jgi:uncharacterized membrane protein YphA (DoxX/SURF4 family)
MGCRVKLSHLPPRLATGVFMVNSGWSKLGASRETAEGLHLIAAGTYPSVRKLDPERFTRLLAIGELTLGAALLVPIVPTGLAGAALTGFSTGLLGLYLNTPGMRQEGSLRPTQQGTPLAKDIWLLGIGAGFIVDDITTRAAALCRRKHRQ